MCCYNLRNNLLNKSIKSMSFFNKLNVKYICNIHNLNEKIVYSNQR